MLFERLFIDIKISFTRPFTGAPQTQTFDKLMRVRRRDLPERSHSRKVQLWIVGKVGTGHLNTWKEHHPAFTCCYVHGSGSTSWARPWSDCPWRRRC
jgi:hypothetical protein